MIKASMARWLDLWVLRHLARATNASHKLWEKDWPRLLAL